VQCFHQSLGLVDAVQPGQRLDGVGQVTPVVKSPELRYFAADSQFGRLAARYYLPAYAYPLPGTVVIGASTEP
jgi:hypothetical protein